MGQEGFEIRKVITDHHRLAMTGLALLVACILIARCFNAVFHPILFNEDGRDILAYFANNPHPSSIFRFYAGYVALLPNTIGFVAVRLLPLPIVPFVFVLVSLGFAVIALTLFSLKRFRFIMPDDGSRMMVCLILSLFPVGNHPLLTTLTFSIWNIFIIALLLTLAPLPRSTAGRIFQFLFIGLAVFSHPFSVLFIPISIGLAFIRRTRVDRLFQSGIVVLAVAYFIFGVRPGTVGSRINVSSLLTTFETLAHRVVFEPVFGNNLRVALHQAHQDPAIILMAAGIIAALAILAIKGWNNPSLGNRAPMFGFAGFIILALTGISVVARTNLYESFVNIAWAQRYFLTQQLLVLFIIVAHAVSMVQWRRIPALSRFVFLMVALVFLVGLNLHNRSFFATSKEQGEKTLEFLRQAEKRRDWGPVAGAGPQDIILRRPPEWDIRINIGDPDAP